MTADAGHRRIGFAALAVMLAITSGAAPRAQRTAPSVTVYKSPTCGCCTKWVDHMRANGFDVTATNVEDMAAVKQKYGVPDKAGSCHTSVVGGYVIEGHVPADVVKTAACRAAENRGVGRAWHARKCAGHGHPGPTLYDCWFRSGRTADRLRAPLTIAALGSRRTADGVELGLSFLEEPK